MSDSKDQAKQGGVRQTSVSITGNGKSRGADVFIKFEEVFEFIEPVTSDEAADKRDELLLILTAQLDQALEIAADKFRASVASTPRGAASVHQVNPVQVPAGSQAGQPVVGTGAQAIQAVANGASFATEWRSAPSRFGDGDIRFLPTSVYPSAKLESEINNWLISKGFNPVAFKIWDNRPGLKGLEAGVPNGAVAAVKISQEFAGTVAPELARNAAARVKFNSDGSLYIWFTKEFEAAVKYNAVESLKGPGF
jgi:hypothetical protein